MPGEVYVQVVGAGTAGLPPSVMLVAGRHRYLFDCGEQTQRFLNEHRLRTQSVDALFLTRVDWHHAGGLSDFLMTGAVPRSLVAQTGHNLRSLAHPPVRWLLTHSTITPTECWFVRTVVADNGKGGIPLYGPAPLYCHVLSMQSFLYRPSFTLDIHQIGTQSAAIAFKVGDKEDEGQIRIRPIILAPRGDGDAPPVGRGGDLHKQVALAFDVGRRVCAMKPELRPVLPLNDSHRPDVLCYAIETPEVRCPAVAQEALPSDHWRVLFQVRGKFDMRKAKALGVPFGPLCGSCIIPSRVFSRRARCVTDSQKIG